MKNFFRVLTLTLTLIGYMTISDTTAATPPANDGKFYEMRIYYAAPGKLEDLQSRFRNHTTKIFEKHGMTNVGYWVPVENTDNKLIYILSYPSKEARDASWKAFGADPEWQAVAKASEANGKLVTKVDSWYLETTGYSPAVKTTGNKKDQRIFELRTYTASPNNADNLHDRFRNHTLKMFKKHGMSSIGYWKPTDKDSDKNNMILYILAYKNRDAATASWKAFQGDSAWAAAKKASEEKGGGSLTSKVESVYMTPTDYSPIK
ncbi:NIPSNAP family protein [Adhaeribacter aquaticus]|uniref:NIPSNAP family protein n=1 Tax=Adhaeribacter aquaticus TaxID=299567 RepID=UPI00041D68CB|nr:NIPSNAP family protein [Adhaeribacter aquaticus]